MAQRMYLYRNNSFINRTRLLLLCEKSGAIQWVLQQAVRQLDEILVDIFLKFSTNRIVMILTAFNVGTVLLFFSSKLYCEACYRGT